jgi:hypothetical protein
MQCVLKVARKSVHLKMYLHVAGAGVVALRTAGPLPLQCSARDARACVRVRVRVCCACACAGGAIHLDFDLIIGLREI